VSNWPLKPLRSVAAVDYGTRVTRKQDGGSQFPVYGGGGETFRVDSWNREDCFIVSRFAMSEVCVRQVQGRIFLNNSGLTVSTLDADALDQAFLDNYLLARSKTIYAMSRGTAQRNLDVSAFKELPIPLPPLDEQKRIVAKLDEATSHIRVLEVSARQRRVLVDALVDTAIKQTWKQLALERPPEVAAESLLQQRANAIRTGPFGSQLLKREFVTDGIPVLGIDNVASNEFRIGASRFITQEKFAELARYRVHPRDVMITIMGTCGRCAIAPQDLGVAISSKHLCVLSVQDSLVMPEYFRLAFLTDPSVREYLSRSASGSVMDGLNMGIIRNTPIKVPSLQRQREVISQVDTLLTLGDRQRRVCGEKLSLGSQLGQSMLAEAIGGAA
jgi:type I restriction enzyme, S subunit